MTYLEKVAQEIGQRVPDNLMPPDAHGLLLMYAVLARAKGTAVTAEDVHDAWAAWMIMRGEDHPAVRPFSELSADVRREDEPFVSAIHDAIADMESVTGE